MRRGTKTRDMTYPNLNSSSNKPFTRNTFFTVEWSSISMVYPWLFCLIMVHHNFLVDSTWKRKLCCVSSYNRWFFLLYFLDLNFVVIIWGMASQKLYIKKISCVVSSPTLLSVKFANINYVNRRDTDRLKRIFSWVDHNIITNMKISSLVDLV